MLISLGCTLEYVVPEESVFIFNLAVMPTAQQAIVHEELRLTPELDSYELIPPETGARHTRIAVPAGPLSVQYEARVERSADPAPPAGDETTQTAILPAGMLPYLFPSRYCQADLLAGLAHEVAGHAATETAKAIAVCDWVHANIRYQPETSDSTTTACETVRDGAGMCRDFAHVAIALCRGIGLPARFVAGYAWGLPLPDFHACMEVFVAGRWRLFDPSRQVPPDHLVRAGIGRDAAEASFATIFSDGPPCEMTSIAVHAEPVAEVGTAP